MPPDCLLNVLIEDGSQPGDQFGIVFASELVEDSVSDQERLLHDVRGIDALLQLLTQIAIRNRSQPIAMPLQQFAERGRLAVAGTRNQIALRHG